jgi:general stress protein YciG
MAGTKEGGMRAAETNRRRYGENFYPQIGRKGGKLSRGGGFALNHDLAVEAGRKGGQVSRRTKELKSSVERQTNENFLQKQLGEPS